MRPRHAMLLVLAVLAAGTAYFAFNAYAPSRPSRYPEFAGVPAADLDRARAALPKKTGGFGHHTPDSVVGITRRLHGCTSWAVVAALVERAGKATGSMTYGRCFEDDIQKPVGAWLAEQADDTLNPVLLRLAADEEMEFPLRDTALVALCRPDNVSALPGLVRLAMDMEAENTVRTRVLSRLHRIGVPPGGDLDALLHLPFRDHDLYAAAVLALTGRPIAPSLILEGLDTSRVDQGLRRLLALGAQDLAPTDTAIAALARRTQEAIEDDWGFTRDGEDESASDRAARDLAAALRDWLAKHPEAGETSFERAWADLRDGERYRRAREVLNAESPAAVPEAEIDFGAAVLGALDPEGKWRDRPLGGLDRMAILFRREIVDAATPQARLEVLHRRLMPRLMCYGRYIEDGPSSFLDRVLRERAGNCVGLTSLYVALGERLELPLVAVALPNHVFLRWEDGADSFDIELTDRGRIRTAEDLEGKRPRVLTKKGLVSIVLSNRSSIYMESPMIRDEDRVESALRFADQAVTWDPANEAAHLARARCLARMGDIEASLAAAEHAAKLSPDDANPLLAAAESLLLADRVEEALSWFGRARDLDSGRPEPVLGRLICLEKLARYEDVVREAEAFPGYEEHRGIRLRRFRAMVRLDHNGWSEEFRALVTPFFADECEIRLETAELLLQRGEAGDALRILAPLDAIGEERAKAEGKEDDERVFVKLAGETTRVMPAGTLRSMWRRTQLLRAGAYEKSGQPKKAQAIRRKLSD